MVDFTGLRSSGGEAHQAMNSELRHHGLLGETSRLKLTRWTMVIVVTSQSFSQGSKDETETRALVQWLGYDGLESKGPRIFPLVDDFRRILVTDRWHCLVTTLV